MTDSLALLLDCGEQISHPCYARGHVLYAILEPESPTGSRQTNYGLAKFLLAIKADADPQIIAQRRNLLRHAQGLKFRLYVQRLTDPTSPRLKDELNEVKVIIKILKDHQRTGDWAVFDHYYDEMVEEVAKELEEPIDEVKAKFAFSH